MRTSSFVFLAVAGLAISCHPKSNESETASDFPTTKCFRFSNERDSVLLTINYSGDSVTGSLAYHWAEKDKSTGTIQGKIAGDLLLADYTFQSEGAQSQRQVAFRIEGNTLLEGYGEIQNINGNDYFSNIDSLKFDTIIILKEAACSL